MQLLRLVKVYTALRNTTHNAKGHVCAVEGPSCPHRTAIHQHVVRRGLFDPPAVMAYPD